ncbi:SCP-like extracellular protein [Sordaria brevicollis]|uniref:SCP-like extracellular protein n=1 Tax=Sordaria brevicollis TaxID=83679 RepID=A0AAE0PKY8_SORBR|nr:SCP-like extracellular protein [Sordaria brevicollis]
MHLPTIPTGITTTLLTSLLPIFILPSLVSAVPQTTGPDSFLNYNIFLAQLTNSTNHFRHQHNASSILFNSTLSTFASSHLQSLELIHSDGPYGENLAIGCSSPQECVDVWGNERKEYNFEDGKFSEETGHFTQLVWRDTKEMGCAARWCETWNEGRGGWYLVCEFWPRGNVEGEFRENVQKGEYSGAGGLRPTGWVKMGVLVGMVGGWLVLV